VVVALAKSVPAAPVTAIFNQAVNPLLEAKEKLIVNVPLVFPSASAPERTKGNLPYQTTISGPRPALAGQINVGTCCLSPNSRLPRKSSANGF
jgi:hypothetical protein